MFVIHIKHSIRPIPLTVLQLTIVLIFVLTEYIYVDANINQRFRETLANTEDSTVEFMSRNAVFLPASAKSTLILIEDIASTLIPIIDEVQETGAYEDKERLNEYLDPVQDQMNNQIFMMKRGCFLLVAMVLITALKHICMILNEMKRIRAFRRV